MYQMYRSFSPRRAHSSPTLTMAKTIALVLAIFCPLFKHSQAMKGKGGRQGHIIVQNEVKGNTVPIYMPIPIPIPMPMGPPAGPQHHHQQAGPAKFFHQMPFQRHQEPADDGEGEVKKIYLLQPVPRAQPQPQLKGGGFMGPIQNHIHIQPASPGKHRHSPSGQHHGQNRHQFQQQHQQQQQQHFGDAGGSDTAGPSSGGHKSEVKILPIVVIPPVAPMPPIQIAPAAPPPPSTSSAAHRLMFSPQFNNFLVSAASPANQQRAKQHRGGGRHGGVGVSFGGNFADYGGSLGGSVFRENFASRSRPSRNSRSSLVAGAATVSSDYGAAEPSHHYQSQQRHSASRPRWPSRGDYDYSDYDYDAPAASREAPMSAYRRTGAGAGGGDADEPVGTVRRRPYRTLAPAASGQRRYRADLANRYKSIRDILDSHKASRLHEDYELGADQQLDGYSQSGSSDSGSESAPASLGGLAALYQQQQMQSHSLAAELSQLDNGFAATSGQQQRGARMSRGGGGAQATNYEILLDELDTQLAAADSRQHAQRPSAQSKQVQQDLSALYYDRGNASGPSTGGDLDPAIALVRLRQRQQQQQQQYNQRQSLEALTEGRDIFDDDEWRFDSIKSVTHAAANATVANGTMTIRTPGAGNINKIELKQQVSGTMVRPTILQPPANPTVALTSGTATNRTRTEPNPH